MQTALLGFAIAIILALVTALVGPYFVDWGSHRAELEATASRLVGLDLQVAGPIDLRILPTPTLTLQQIAFGRPGDPARTRAQALRIEFSLPALISGELRAADLKLQGPELAVSVDESGRLDWSAPSIGFDPDAVSIDHLDIEDGRATVTDAVSGTRRVLDKLRFTGQVSSLRGPVKGQGSFTLDGRPYPYRLAMSRAGDDGAVKLRLNLDSADIARTAELDASIWLDRGIPHFDGTVQWSRAAAPGLAGNAEGAVEATSAPWRVTGHVRGDSTAAVLEQIDLQYGADEQAVRLHGDAKLTFGAKPELVAALSSPQIDLDRVLALPDAVARRPLVAIKRLAEIFAGTQHLPIAVRLGISVDTVTFAGAMLQRVGGDLTSDGDSWNIERFALRAPGLTQVAFSGRPGSTASGVAFAGATKIESADPRVLAGWLADRGNIQLATSGPLRVAGDVTLGSEKIVLDRLQVELERMSIEGHVDYAWPAGDQPARLNATLHAPQLDLDRAQVLLAAGLGDVSFEWPREGTLAIDIGRAVAGAIEVKDINIKLLRDGGGLDIERLAIGDIGGAGLAVAGRIDTHGSAPRGAVTLDLDARNLDGVAGLLEKFSSPAADRLRRLAGRAVPAKLRGTLAVDQDGGGAGGIAGAKFSLAGSAGLFRIDLQGDADAGRALALTDLAKLGGSKIDLAGQLDAGDGGALVELLGLDRLLAVDKRAGRLTFNARGPLDGDLTVAAKLAAGGLDASANGTMRLGVGAGDGPSRPDNAAVRPTAQLAVKIAAANIDALAFLAGPHSAPLPPSKLTARLAWSDNSIALTDLDGTLAGTTIKGRLGIALTQPARMDGDLAIGAIDLPAAVAAAIGMPHAGQSGDAAWPAEPFERGLLGGASGRIKVKAGRLSLASRLAARDLDGVLSFDPTQLAVGDLDGALAGGRIAGGFTFVRGPDGITARSHLALSDAAAAELLASDGKPPLSGRVSIDLDLAGAGRSPVALIGSLEGSGTFALQDGSIARFDPAAFERIMRAVDQGLASDATRIKDPVEAALSNGILPIASARATITVDMGQLRLADTVVQAKGADLAVAASVDLTQYAMDASLTLSGPMEGDSAGGRHPDITVSLKGPIDAPKRQLDVAALATWLALRAADQKSKRLEALQARELERDRGDDSIGSAVSVPAVTAPAIPAPAIPAPPPPRRIRPRPSAADQSPLPPPIDIRPQSLPHPPRADAGGTRVDGMSRSPRPAAALPGSGLGIIGP